jgi:protoheme ferro-lyase
MQLKIVQFDVQINEDQVKRLNETLSMQLGRYTQIIEIVNTSFKNAIDQFGQKIIQCSVVIELLPDGSTTTSNTAITIEDAFYNSISRAKRQLDRQRRSSKRLFSPTYTINK